LQAIRKLILQKWDHYYYAAGQRERDNDRFESKVDFKFASFAMGTDKELTYSDPVIMSAQ